MTIRAWLATRVRQPPAVLTERVDAALGCDLDADASQASERCIVAADAVLRELLHRPATADQRGVAIDLLTVDALVTYAFEAPADNADVLAARTDDAMHRFARIGAGSRHETHA